MKVTRETRTFPLMTFGSVYGGSSGVGPPGSVPTSTGSNMGVAWASNVATITSNGSNLLLGPFINFASGSNVLFTLDQGPQPLGAVPSNTLRIHAVGSNGGPAISGLTIKDEGTPLATLADTLDFVGAGVTASGGGATKTITISGGGGSTTHEDGFTKPDSAGTYDEEFEGTADTLPTNWSWISTPSTWKLNSQWKSRLVADHAESTSETKELRRASFTPGSVDFGLWWHMTNGTGAWNNNTSYMDLFILNSGETEGRGIKLSTLATQLVQSRSLIASVEANVSDGYNSDYVAPCFFGMTRKTSDNTWRFYYSWDGASWFKFGSVPTHSFTVDRIRVRFNSGSNAGVERHTMDFVRYRADLLLWAPR